MDNSIKVFKYQLYNFLKPLGIYYLFMMGLYCFLSIQFNETNATSSGLEVITAIIILTTAIEMFKSSFYFTQGNNISRKSYLIGTLIAGLVVSALSSLIDLVLNRIYNLFIPAAMNFDMIYGNFGVMDSTYVANNSFENLITTFLWTFILFFLVFIVGLLISMVYFRLSSKGKIITILAGITVYFGSLVIGLLAPDFMGKIFGFIQLAMGLETRNPYSAIISFTMLIIMIGTIQFTIMKKAVADKR